jgi:hypothetical protein
MPPMVDAANYNLANDPYDVEKVRLREAHKRRDKEIVDMKVDSERDPLKLWSMIKECHQTLTTSKVASVIKKTAREEYAACKQGMYEHIVDYK